MESIIAGIASQLPVVVIFVWFILKWTDKHENSLEKRDQAWVKAIQERDQAWIAFLKEERSHRHEGMSRLAEELKQVAKELAIVKDILVRHDERADTYIDSRIIEEKTK